MNKINLFLFNFINMNANNIQLKHSYSNSNQNNTVNNDNIYDKSLKTYIEEIKYTILSKKKLINSIRSTHLNASIRISDSIQIKKYLLTNLLDEFEYTISSSLKMIQIFNAEISKFKNPKKKMKLKTTSKMNLPEQITSFEKYNQFINDFFRKRLKIESHKEIISKENSMYNIYNPRLNNFNELSQQKMEKSIKTETNINSNKIKNSELNNSNANRILNNNHISIEANHLHGFYTNKSCSNMKDQSNLKITKNKIQNYRYHISHKIKINDLSTLYSKKDETRTDINTINTEQNMKIENLKQDKINSARNSEHKIPKTIREKIREKSNSIKKNNKKNKIDNFQNKEKNALIQNINNNEKVKNFIVQKYGKGDYNLFLWKLKFGQLNKNNLEKDILLFNQLSYRNKKSNNYCNNDFLNNSKTDTIPFEKSNKIANNFNNNSNYKLNY